MAEPNDLAPPDPERCHSLRRVVLHREDELEVYVRCLGRENHLSKSHRSKLLKWRDEHESGFLDDGEDW